MSGCVLRSKGKIRSGFTLVELVVIVLILGILAAVAAPKMFDTAGAARDNSTRQSLGVVRDAIQLYRARENAYPADPSSDLADYLTGPFPAAQVGNANSQVFITTDGTAPLLSNGKGWMYYTDTGEFYVNDPAHLGW